MQGLLYKTNGRNSKGILGTAFINVLVRISLWVVVLLLLFPEFRHRKQLEVGLIGSILWENVVVIFFPAGIRLEREKGASTFLSLLFVSLFPESLWLLLQKQKGFLRSIGKEMFSQQQVRSCDSTDSRAAFPKVGGASPCNAE